MRFYDITITKDGKVIRPASLASLNLPSSFSSYVNGATLPGALDIELNLVANSYNVFEPSSSLVIWGVGIKEISQATNLGGCKIIIRAGMKKGLPLANPKQAGVVAQGTIFQPFGQWQGNRMSLNMNLVPDTGEGITPPKNFSFNWKKGSALADPLKAALTAALPGFTISVQISDQLVATATYPHIGSDLSSFSKMINALTNVKQFAGIKTVDGSPYAGVTVNIQQSTVIVTDNTVKAGGTASNPKQIVFNDLIGQPTWFTPVSIAFKTVLRGDIQVGDIVKLPAANALLQGGTGGAVVQGGGPATNGVSTFKGNFTILSMVHFGRFRQADADAWCTAFQASVVPSDSTPAASDAQTTANNNAIINKAFNEPPTTTTLSPAQQLANGIIPP